MVDFALGSHSAKDAKGAKRFSLCEAARLGLKTRLPLLSVAVFLTLFGTALAPELALAANQGGGFNASAKGWYIGQNGPSDNTVTIDTATNVHTAGGYGGGSNDVTNNKLSFETADFGNNCLYGGHSGSGDAVGNELHISSGSTGYDNYGGNSQSGGSANSNNVFITGGTLTGYATVGGRSQSGSGSANNNTVEISGSAQAYQLYGGETHGSGNAESNAVNVKGGTVSNDIIGGLTTSSGSATGNTVDISGGTVNGAVYGGWAKGSGNATGNTVRISENAAFGANAELWGGKASAGHDGRTGNTLEMRKSGVSVTSINNFANLHFYLPSNLAANSTMLTLGSTGITDISGASVGVGFIDGGAPSMVAGDSVTLIDASAGGLTADSSISNSFSTMAGISKIYEFTLAADSKKLRATVAGAKESPEEVRQSPAEGHTAAVSLVTQGLDLAAGPGMTNAVSAARMSAGQSGGRQSKEGLIKQGQEGEARGNKRGATGLAGGSSNLGLAAFGAVSGGTSRYKTGGHTDVDSASLMTGLVKQVPSQSVDAIVGAFFETGLASYDTYNSHNGASIHGKGDSRYYGGGLLGRLELTEGWASGLYTEGSLRIGHLSTDYSSDDLNPGRRADYDTGAAYYGAHAGLGYIWGFSEKASVDLYGKYLWTRTEDSAVRILGDEVKFKAVDSHRTRTGARFNYAVSESVTPYVGGAWEYEFDGESNSIVAGLSTPAPSVKGSTGLGELGLTWKPVDSALSLDFGVQGYVGMRKGVSGSLQLKYEI